MLHAQASWRGLVVALEQRCSPYDADDYRYPQSVEDRIVAELGGVYGPYTGRWFASTSDTDIKHMVARCEAHDSGLCATDLATRRAVRLDPQARCLEPNRPQAPGELGQPATAILSVEGVGQADGDILTRHPAAEAWGESTTRRRPAPAAARRSRRAGPLVTPTS